MSSVGIAVNSKNFWKGTDLIEKKLGSVLDRKVTSSTKQVLLDRIEFKEASKPDPFYQQLKKKYTPLNSGLANQQNSNNQGQNTNKDKVNGKVGKDELPAPKYVLFAEDKVHLQWKTVRSVGPGLFNLGNTCFLNSVIQVLTYTPPLVNYLASQEHSTTCATVGFCMLCELQRHVLRTFTHTQHEAIKPLAILQKLKYIAKHLRFGEQEDSHEFLRYVIDGMMKSCLAGVSEKLDAYSKATTVVHQVFGGYYRSQVTCEKCHHTSNTYDPLMEVLLDIKHTHSVLNALHKLISVELLNGDNMYLCPRCKRKVPAKKNLRVHQPPNVMTMCLKRFDSHSLFASKINKEVSYPEHLNLRPFMSKNQGPAVHYKLYAVLVHSGYSCNSGHYYCFIKAASNHWYLMNDSSVRQVSLKTVLDQQAYLLFYVKDHHTQKEKPGATQQPVRTACTNGTKNARFNPQKQHLPKVITEPTKKPNKTPAPQFPKRPEPSLKANAQANPRPTSLPQQREKVTFALNNGTQLKKPNAPQVAEQKESQTKADKTESLKPETKAPQDCKEENRTSFEKNETLNEELQVNEISSSVEESKKQNLNSGTAKHHENGPTFKDIAKEMKTTQDLHATTKWNVTKNETLPTGLLPGSLRPGATERTPSMSSELSNPGSVASKTGDWSISDRNTSQHTAPRIAERQHAGWNVSQSPSKEKMSVDIEGNGQTTEEINTDQIESHKKPKKRKHSKEKHERKKTKVSEDETKLVSDECREESDDERRRKKLKRLKKLEKAKKRKSGEDSSSGDEQRESRKKHKKNKKKKKHKRERVLEDECRSTSKRRSSERSFCKTEENEQGVKSSRESLLSSRTSDNFEKKISRTKHIKTDKRHSDSDKIKSDKTRHEKVNGDASFKERARQHSENTENDSTRQNKSKRNDRSSEYNTKEDEFRTKSTSKVDINGSSVIEKGKELMDKVSESRKKDKNERKRLIPYSDDSSEEQDEDNRGKSRINDDTSREPKDSKGEKDVGKRVNSSSSREIPRESKDRRNVVDTLLVTSHKSSNYGRLVERWDGERDEIPVGKDTKDKKRRRDMWDEEYDRGKLKRTKNKDKFHNHSYHGENSFQREYDRKRMRNDGWHSSSSYGWNRRNHHDRHSWRDRR